MHFYAMNDITLNRKKIGRYVPENIRKHTDRTYTREEITRLLEFCDLRDRSIVLLFASTGIRIGGIPDLRLEHLTKIEKYSLYQITVYQGHSEEYITFCTPECRNAIDNYLNYRERCGEDLTPKSPLFREQFDVNDLEQIRKKAKTIVENTITKMLGKKLHLAGIIQIEQLKEGEDPTKKRKAVMRSHGFRKFVNTTMINCRIDSSIRNKLLGHSIALDKSYWRPQVNDLLQEYLKCVDALTINEEYRLKKKIIEYEDKLKDAPKIGELESHLASKIIEQDALKNQVERLQLEKQNETKAMQQKYEQEMNSIREQMNQIISLIQQNPVLANVKPEVLIKKKSA
jgi:integrase